LSTSATRDLKHDHVLIRRIRDISQKCSDGLYEHRDIPVEDVQIICVVIEEFIDAFHHNKEEKAYFPETQDKNVLFFEEVRKFTLEHEFGRRIARMLLRHLQEWKRHSIGDSRNDNMKYVEPVARFLKTYAIFITDHTGKEDRFFDSIEENQLLSEYEDTKLIKHYQMCRNSVGGSERINQLLKLIEYLEQREWMIR
jgi:hemerythrin-like domain-containing protein